MIYHTSQKANNKVIDKTEQMCRLACAFVGYMQPISVFSGQAHFKRSTVDVTIVLFISYADLQPSN